MSENTPSAAPSGPRPDLATAADAASQNPAAAPPPEPPKPSPAAFAAQVPAAQDVPVEPV
ncbi:gamma-glutamyl-gamma-aminobutyrate hydrolase, partial [Burkholderia sp. Ac-20379]|nr:gamma-glutamyl-gamma-aminobutyrate hydrolase [Burkholderia sp. Ac-20379]